MAKNKKSNKADVTNLVTAIVNLITVLLNLVIWLLRGGE